MQGKFFTTEPPELPITVILDVDKSDIDGDVKVTVNVNITDGQAERESAVTVKVDMGQCIQEWTK